jgi:hypothetical protein
MNSKEKRSTTNALISSILTKYAEWDRYVESFVFISMPRNGFKLIIDALDDESIKRVAEEIGSRQPKERMMFIFKKMTLHSYPKLRFSLDMRESERLKSRLINEIIQL